MYHYHSYKGIDLVHHHLLEGEFNMIFKNYNYFLTINKEKNITRAAEKLFISQPSLSKYLKRLESKLEIDLFDHSTNPLG
jgi:DNA-binding transcriptional LysR family regulator